MSTGKRIKLKDMRGRVGKKKPKNPDKVEKKKKAKEKDERLSKKMTINDKNISLTKIEKYLDSIQKDASAVSVKPKGGAMKKALKNKVNSNSRDKII